MQQEFDSGWGPALSEALLGLIPVWGSRRRRMRARAGDGLTNVRSLYLVFVVSFALIGVVVAILEDVGSDMGSVAEAPAAAGVVAVGLASLAAPRLARRPLPCESQSALASGYRERFFLHMAFAEASALVGFIGYMVSSAGWLYPVGVLFTANGLARLAPTARHLQHDQEDLRRRGCTLSLVTALRQLPERP